MVALPLLLCLATAVAGAAVAPGRHASAAHAKEKAPASVPAKPKPEPTWRIGEINTYKNLPDFSAPYRHGWELALEQINAGGGVLGQKIEVLSRDDNGNPDDAVKAAQDLVGKDSVLALFGAYSSEVALALSHFATDSKVPYLAVAPLSQRLTWQDESRYVFRLRASAWMQAAAVAPKALGQRKPHWAAIYNDNESDRSTVAAFKGLLKSFQPKAEFVDELAVPAGKFDAAAAVKALADAKPDAIFNMLSAPQLTRFVQEGNAQHLFDQRPVVSLFTGDPENLEPLGTEVPAGWIVTGYPWDAIDTPANNDFVAAYRQRYNETPRMASVLGYASMMSLAAALKRAGTADSERLAGAFSGLKVDTPFGPIEYRALDHQSTLGTYLGYTAVGDGKATMEQFIYADGKRLQPLDEQVRRLLPGGDTSAARHAMPRPPASAVDAAKTGTAAGAAAGIGIGQGNRAAVRAPSAIGIKAGAGIATQNTPPALPEWPAATPPAPAAPAVH